MSSFICSFLLFFYIFYSVFNERCLSRVFSLESFSLRLFVAGRHESRITLQRTASLDAGIEALRIRSLQLSLLVGTSGLEPPTSRLSGARSNHLSYAPLWLLAILFPSVLTGGDDGIRTHDPLLAGQVLSQLSYTPIFMRLFPVTEN